MLSQDITVNGGVPSSRRSRSASTMNPNGVVGVAPSARSGWISGCSASNSPVEGWKRYPPSVMVSETMRVLAALIAASTAPGSSAAWRNRVIDPITRGSRRPSGYLTTRV